MAALSMASLFFFLRFLPLAITREEFKSSNLLRRHLLLFQSGIPPVGARAARAHGQARARAYAGRAPTTTQAVAAAAAGTGACLSVRQTQQVRSRRSQHESCFFSCKATPREVTTLFYYTVLQYKEVRAKKTWKNSPKSKKRKMAGNFPVSMGDVSEVPMSRTHQYRKVMKPLLERKRRARINHCLDELKDLMVFALQTEGESITKLEKADVLEITVRHLQKLKAQNKLQFNPAASQQEGFRRGYSSCVNEVSAGLAMIPGVNVNVGMALMSHLGGKLEDLNSVTNTASSPSTSPRLEPVVPMAQDNQQPLDLKLPQAPPSDSGYYSGRESVSPRSLSSTSPVNFPLDEVKRRMSSDSNASSNTSSSGPVWRPF